MISKRFFSGFRWLLQQPWLWLLLWGGGLLYLNHPAPSLRADEAYYAQQARWMLQHNNWITIGWEGVPQVNQPPGLPWLMAWSYHWFGYSELTVRLPATVAAAMALGLTWRVGQRLLPPLSGLWGAAILAVLPLWIQASKLGTPDMLGVALPLLGIWALLHSEDHPQRRLSGGLGAGIAFSAGFLVSGVMAVLPLVALLPYLVRGRHSHHHLQNPGLYCGLGLGAIPTGIWLGRTVARHGVEALYPLVNQFRLLGLPPGAGAPAITLEPTARLSYYLWHLPLTTLPWVLLTLVGAWLVGRNPQVGRRTLWLGYPVVLLVGLSLVEPRHGSYALPIYPFMALLAAVGLHYLGRLYRSAAPSRYRVALALGWGLGVLAMGLISAGLALLLTPGELMSPELRLYGWVGLLGGIGGLVPWIIGLNRQGRITLLQQWLWQGGWLVGPWLGLAAVFLTGLWGNYSPDIKQALHTGAIASTLAHNRVHVVSLPDAPLPGAVFDQSHTMILLTAYTPYLGELLAHWQDLPSETYAWVNVQAVLLDNLDHEVVGTVDDWQLLRAPFDRLLTPRG